MSTNFNYITDRMLIGEHLCCQQDFDNMISLGVTHIVCLLDYDEDHHDTEYLNPRNIRILCNETSDDHLLKSHNWHQQIIDFVLDALTQTNSRVYMHCAAGQSRSAIAWYTVLRALGYSPVNAKATILSARTEATLWPDYINGAEQAIAEYTKTPK
jgi:predicted protein tyrosine phosphatase